MSADPPNATNRPDGVDSSKGPPDYLKFSRHTEPDRRYDDFGQKFKRKVRENPFVPLGFLATVAALSVGLYTLKSGNSELSQKMMRCRVLAQGFTVCALLGGVWLEGHSRAQKEALKKKN